MDKGRWKMGRGFILLLYTNVFYFLITSEY